MGPVLRTDTLDLMKNLPIQMGVGVVGILLLGGLLFFYSTEKDANSPISTTSSEDTAQNLEQNSHETETASTSVPIVLVGQDGTSKKAIATQVPLEESNSLYISFASLPSDLVLRKEPWMDFKKFDSELTKLETEQKKISTETQSNWSKIIASTDSQSQMVVYIQNSIDSVQTSKQQLTKVLSMVRNPPSDITSEKKQILSELDAVVTDLLLLYENQINIKSQTLAAVQGKNVSKAVIAANDEDRMSLVISWHDKQYNDLFSKYKAGVL